MAITKVYGKRKGKGVDTLTALKDIPKKSEQQVLNQSPIASLRARSPINVLAISPRPSAHPAVADVPTDALSKLTLRVQAPQEPFNRSPSNQANKSYSHVQPLLNYGGQKGPISFTTWLRKWMKHCDIQKIGDGTYSNVYRLSSKSNPNDSVVGKLIPLRPMAGKGSRTMHFTPAKQALEEVRMMEALADVEGFVELRSARVLVGCMPIEIKDLSKAWDQQMRVKGTTAQDEKPRSYEYPKNQLWLFSEMDHAGRELEVIIKEGFEGEELEHWRKRGRKPLEIGESRDIFYQVTRALAMAEKARNFEHRDLHISNICIKRNPQKQRLEGKEIFNRPTDLEVSIIDFTISRAEINGEVIYQPFPLLEDDSYDDIQLQTYLDQYRAANLGTSKDDNATFLPVTNVFWIHYLLVKLLEQTKIATGSPDEENKILETMLALKDQIDPSEILNGRGIILTAEELLYYLEHGRENYFKAAQSEIYAKTSTTRSPVLRHGAMHKLREWRLQRWKGEDVKGEPNKGKRRQ